MKQKPWTVNNGWETMNYGEGTKKNYRLGTVTFQQVHNVKTTSIQRWFNVKTLNQRLIDVVSALCVCRAVKRELGIVSCEGLSINFVNFEILTAIKEDWVVNCEYVKLEVLTMKQKLWSVRYVLQSRN